MCKELLLYICGQIVIGQPAHTIVSCAHAREEKMRSKMGPNVLYIRAKLDKMSKTGVAKYDICTRGSPGTTQEPR